MSAIVEKLGSIKIDGTVLGCTSLVMTWATGYCCSVEKLGGGHKKSGPQEPLYISL